MYTWIPAAVLLVISAATLLLWLYLKKQTGIEIIRKAELHARQLAEDSARYAETIKREANLEAKDKFYAMKSEVGETGNRPSQRVAKPGAAVASERGEPGSKGRAAGRS